MAKGSGKKEEALKAKEDIIAQAEASNSAALSDVPAKKDSKASKPNFVPLSKSETEKDLNAKVEKKFDED